MMLRGVVLVVAAPGNEVDRPHRRFEKTVFPGGPTQQVGPPTCAGCALTLRRVKPVVPSSWAGHRLRYDTAIYHAEDNPTANDGVSEEPLSCFAC